ncbi:MAG: (d)CMP kinase [Actinomycetota bacterium]
MSDALDGRKPILIAIDGPAGSGKSTVSQALSLRLGLDHVDTGAMYRALAWKALSINVPTRDSVLIAALLKSTTVDLKGEEVILDGRDVSSVIRSPQAGAAASKMARNAEVRRWLVERQREIARRNPAGAVVEGRDIGTVVLPDADLKIFLTAALDERARRKNDPSGSGTAWQLEDLASRDLRDTQRSASPLVAAEDAVVLDTTDLSAEETVEKILEMVNS